MKTSIRILKVFVLIITSIWGIIFGIFAPVSIMNADFIDPEITQHFILVFWIINSVLFYIVGTLILMLSCYKIAAIFHTLGLIGSLIIYGTFESIYKGQNPAGLYMPIIFSTFLTIAIAVIANWGKIDARLKSEKKKEYKAAPSIIGGTYEYKEPDKKPDVISKKKGKK